MIQIVAWIYVNLKHQMVYDPDAAKVFYHTAQFWKQKTLLIPDWDYMTTAEWDCSSLLALPVYAVTQNIFLSFSLSNIINLLLFVYILFSLLKNCHVSRNTAFLTIAFMLIPFDWGSLSYSNVLFFGAGQYIYKTLLPLWLLNLMTSPVSRKSLYGIKLCFFFALYLISIISSGIYVFICGVFPVLLFDLWGYVKDRKDIFKGLILPAIVLILTALGLYLQRLFNLETLSDSMTLVLLKNFAAQFAANIESVFALFAALPLKETLNVNSLAGGVYALKTALVVFLLIIGLIPIRRIVSITDSAQSSAAFTVEYLDCILAALFCWNFFILQLTSPTARYQLIGVIPLILSCGLTVSRWISKNKAIVVSFVFSFLILFISAYHWKNGITGLRSYYPDYYNSLSKLADEYDVDCTIMLNDSGNAELARAFDLDKNYLNANQFQHNDPTTFALKNFDISRKYDDRQYLPDRHMLLTYMNSYFDDLPSYIKCHYTKLGTFNEDDIYISDVNLFDGHVGPRASYETTDFPFSYGYEFDHSMDDNGFFPSGDAREIVKSAKFGPIDKTVTVSITYETEPSPNPCGSVTCFNEDSAATFEMTGDNHMVSFDIEPNTLFWFSINIARDTRLSIQKIHFLPHQP